jgi:hypothetical protein
MSSNPKKAIDLTPNAVTIAAMQEARQGNLETVTLDELQAVLDEDDEAIESMQTQEPSP